jgi:cobaltochelatase CobN
MHLLAAQPGGPVDAGAAVDLGQSPADVVVLSAADTELACLAAAQARRGPDAPTLRLANLMQLAHPLSVDVYVEKVIRHAKLVVVRLLGGTGYWPYGVERLMQAAPRLALLPGDDNPDPDLAERSSLPAAALHRLWRYLAEGGIDNAEQALRYAADLIEVPTDWREPAPLLRAGLYWPGETAPDLDALLRHWRGTPVAPIVFYRALVQAGQTGPVDALVAALQARGLNPLPVYVPSLKDATAQALIADLLEETQPAVVLNATAFAVGTPGADAAPIFGDAPVLQVVFSGGTREVWENNTAGLSARDIAMHVALPEVDGRILTRAVSFKAEAAFDRATQCAIVSPRAEPDRVELVAALAANWARLRATPPGQRRVALLLANYPNRDGRLANGVGLDTPASTAAIIQAMTAAGYDTGAAPRDGAALIAHLQAGPTNDLKALDKRTVAETLPLDGYRAWFASLSADARDKVTARWGAPDADPCVRDGAFRLPLHCFGNLVVGVQPARGYNVDPKASYHDPDLPPPHHYLAAYCWLRETFGTHAIVHVGKHGNLEWLPGKALALSADCFPEAALGPLPHLYPFIVNDPGEGAQAKRRAAAVVVDHLMPPLTRAESYGPLRELERLVDEYFDAAGLDPRRLNLLRRQILEQCAAIGLDKDLGFAADETADLQRLDGYLCELKEMQIRDGLHVFGSSPEGGLLTDLLVALARVPRGDGRGSLHQAIAKDLGLGFDPLDCDMSAPWNGPKPEVLVQTAPPTSPSIPLPPQAGGEGGEASMPCHGPLRPSGGRGAPMGARRAPQPDLKVGLLGAGEVGAWRSTGDTVERVELLAQGLVANGECPADWPRTAAVLAEIDSRLRPAVTASGAAEIAGLMTGLDGRFVAPGPSGAPTRGRPEVLPTGRNFYAVDTRAVPTPAAWQLGWKSAGLLIERYRQEHGEWPRAVALSAWGTANMRTGGDDIAQALALLGARPTWDGNSARVTGFEILPVSLLDRPRVDVMLRISGFFRDAFPHQIALFDAAVQAVAKLDEPASDNPLAARVAEDAARLAADGDAEPERRASFRVFGSKPGAYGAGLQALIDERGWQDDADLARAYVAWGGYAYGEGVSGTAAPALFRRRLAQIQAVLHNQDNREHDLLDSDDYYQFEGGLAAAVRVERGQQPAIYHNDHSRPQAPRIRRLEEEIARVVRARVVNPKWIAGVMRHGYKGAFEIAATVDYLFAFAATARVVGDHHFDAVHDAFVADPHVAAFISDNNPAAAREIAERLLEAQARGLWRPKRNATTAELHAALEERP